MPSYGQGRDHVGPRRAALIGGSGLNDVVVTSAEDVRVACVCCQANAHRVDGAAVVSFTAYDDVYLIMCVCVRARAWFCFGCSSFSDAKTRYATMVAARVTPPTLSIAPTASTK